ncbi:MAG: cupin domain-containing protein [Thermoleophilia bacterium]
MQDGVTTARFDLRSDERFQSLRRDLGVSSFGLNVIVLPPGGRGRIHAHETQEEVYLVLDGTLSLALEDGERDLGVGEAARVAPAVRRQLVNRGPGSCAVLALGGAGEHVGRDGLAYASWDATEPSTPQDLPLPEDLPASELRT